MAAAAIPHFSPHAAFASASAASSSSADPGPAAGSDAEAGFAVFRLLLPPSFSDADTMRLYAAVNPLRRRTAALQVRVEPLDSSAAGGRVVAAVLGPTAPVRRVEASSSSGEPLALSPAQEALVAVIDAEGALYRGRGQPGCATCLLLVDAELLEKAAGKGALERIALGAGATVRVLPWDEGVLPPRGQPPEEIIELTGDRTSVRKALVALSSCLQGDLPFGSPKTSVIQESSMLPWESSEVHEPNVGTPCPDVSTEYAKANVPQTDCPKGITGDAQSKCLQQISFRLLLPIHLAGGLIGKKGAIVKGIEDETGACIDVSAPVSGCTERVITICALESPKSEYHIVQNALLLIFDRLMEMERTSQSLARALVLKNQFGRLVGLGGSTIKEMVNATGARIQILDDADVPACASQFELVLQITGDLINVRNALCLVCWKLRNHVFSNGADYNNGCIPSSNVVESNATSQANIYSAAQHSTDNFHRIDPAPAQCYGMDSVEKSFSSFDLNSSGVQKPDNGKSVQINNSDTGMQKPAEWNDLVTNNLNHGATFSEENNLVRGAEHATITRITYETAVSGSILNLVYGDNGNNLNQLIKMSGAEIAVYDPPSEGNEAVIVVSGPPDQAQSAQRLLVELILQGQ